MSYPPYSACKKPNMLYPVYPQTTTTTNKKHQQQVEVNITSLGRRYPIEDAFPLWILKRFSKKAKEDFGTSNNVNQFRVPGPASPEAIRVVLGWMVANADKSQTTLLNPQRLSFRQMLMVYHISQVMRVIPSPKTFRQAILDHMEAIPMRADECDFIIRSFKTIDPKLIERCIDRIASFYVSGDLDSELSDLEKLFTEFHPHQIWLQKRIMEIVDWQDRKAKRDNLSRGRPIATVVHRSWKDRHNALADAKVVEESSTPKEFAKVPEETLEDKLRRLDAARQGEVELTESDIDGVLANPRDVCYTINARGRR